MLRRAFLVTSAAALATPAFSQGSYASVRLKQTRFSGKNRSHNYKRISDPTGSAPTRRVERFELRGGDCSNRGDCTPRPLGDRMVSRTRIERVFVGKMGEGDEGLMRYSVYLPSGEYTPVPHVGSTMGQLLWNFTSDGDGDSTPIFSLGTNWDARSTLEGHLSEVKTSEAQHGRVRSRASRIGSLISDAALFDRWHEVQCRFRLSSGSDGFVEPFFSGRALGRLTGRTMTRGGIVEIRYGIYQTGTNQYPGGVDAIPTQVALYSQVGLFKRV